MQPAIRVVAGSPSQSILGNKRIYAGLGDLLEAHPSEISLETYRASADFRGALAQDRSALVTLVVCHGYRLDGHLAELSWGREQISTPLAAPIHSNAVIFNVCFAAKPDGSPADLVRSAVEGRAWLGGTGIVQRSHVTWFAEELVKLIGAGRRSELEDPHDALHVLEEISAVLQPRRDRHLPKASEVKWNGIWGTPRFV